MEVEHLDGKKLTTALIFWVLPTATNIFKPSLILVVLATYFIYTPTLEYLMNEYTY